MMIRKLTALVLAVLLIAALLCTGAGAATADNVRHYDTYLCLGDSIAAGYGPYNREIKGFARVDLAYHAMVADAVTADTLYPYGCTGMRTEEVRWMLDGSYTGDENLFELYNIPEPRRSELRAQVQQAAREADLITVNVGSNDVLTYAFSHGMAALNATDSQLTAQIKAMLAQGGNIGEALVKLFSAAQTAGRLPAVLAVFVEGMYQGYQNFKHNWDPMIKAIYDANPDVTLVVVGMTNPMKNVKLTELSIGRIGSAFDVVTRMMDQYMKSRSAYAGKYLFADVWDTEYFDLTLTSGVNQKDMINLMHPTLDGHKHIAERILAVLPERGAEPDPKPTDDPQPSDTPVKEFPFTDVKTSDWFYDSVYYVWDNDVMQGMTPTTFDPQGTTTRAQFATVLYRMAGSPAVSDADRSACPFTDLTADWYRDAVVWAYKNGVVNGVSATRFAPNAGITREPLVTMLYRYEGSPESTTALSFADAASISPYARAAVAWAVENGIVNGMPGNTFQPKGSATRAQLAAILHRFMAQ